MKMKLQESGVGIEKFSAIGHAVHGQPEQIPGCRAASPASPNPQGANPALDQDYVRSMEERYGIREEGIF